MSDTDALQRYAAERDPEAFAELVEQYQQMVFTVCMRRLNNHEADARDAMQDTFVKLAKSAGLIRGNLAGWLHRCATTSAIDLIRSESRRRERERKTGLQREHLGPSSGVDPDWAEVRVALDEALDEMPERYRVLVVQRYLAGRTQADLAQEYGVSQSMISRKLSKAVDVLRERLSGKGFVLGGIVLAAGMDAEASLAVPTGLAGWPTMVGVAGVGSGAGASAAGFPGSLLSGLLPKGWLASGLLTGGLLPAAVLGGLLVVGAGAYVVSTRGGGGASSAGISDVNLPSSSPAGPLPTGATPLIAPSSAGEVLLTADDSVSPGFAAELRGTWTLGANESLEPWARGSRVWFGGDQYVWRSAEGGLLYHGRLESVTVGGKLFWREVTAAATEPGIAAWAQRRPFMFWDVAFEDGGQRFEVAWEDGGERLVFERVD